MFTFHCLPNIEVSFFRIGIYGILFPKLFWPTLRKIVLVNEKHFWNSCFFRAYLCFKQLERSEQLFETKCFSNFSCMFLNPNTSFACPLVNFRNQHYYPGKQLSLDRLSSVGRSVVPSNPAWILLKKQVDSTSRL